MNFRIQINAVATALIWVPRSAVVMALPFLIVFAHVTCLSSRVEAEPAVYIWRVNASGDWQVPSNWEPARTSPAPDDTLMFIGGGDRVAINLPTESIGQLLISGGTSVNLQSATSSVLTVSGGLGDDLWIESGASLTFGGANAITCRISPGATGRIQGAMSFSPTAPAADRLQATDAGALVFDGGSAFTATGGFIGHAFGTADLNSVIFESGSAYISISGGDPFGAPEPDSVVVFRTGSLFSLRGDATPSFSGRTYANFELNAPGRRVWTDDGGGALVLDDLTLVTGELYLVTSDEPGYSIKGNINLMPHTLLSFSTGTVRLNGTRVQTFRGASLAQAVDARSRIVIDNPAGLVILNLGFIAWNLELRNGIIDAGQFYVGVAGDLVRINGYVNGYMHRIFFEPGSYTFEVGTQDAYSPVELHVTSASSWPSGVTIRAHASAQPNIPNPSKALTRYWEAYQSGAMSGDLTFHYLDADVPITANESNFLIQKFNGTFSQPPGVVDTAANTFHVSGLTDIYRDWTLAEPSALLAAGNTPFDFDGDGRSDLSVFRPSVGEWYYQRSLDGVVNGYGFGSSTDKPVPVDFTGDGKTDIAFFRPSTGDWYVLRSEDSTYYAFPFGTTGDIPAPADYDGDGMADPAVYRPSAQTWFLLRSTGGFTAVQFGSNGDVPVPADYDGDGKSDVAIYRPSVGQWWILRSLDNSVFAATFGDSSDKPVPGDYTGDGKADIAFYRPSEGNWYVIRSEDQSFYAFPFGNSTDKPAPADFDGDGKYDAAVFRPSDTNWYILRSTGGVTIQQFGAADDIPLPGAFVP